MLREVSDGGGHVHTELPFWTSVLNTDAEQEALVPFALLDNVLTKYAQNLGIYHVRLFTETYCVNDPRVKGVHYRRPITLRMTSNTGDFIDLDYWTLFKLFRHDSIEAVERVLKVSSQMLERQPVLSYRYDGSDRSIKSSQHYAFGYTDPKGIYGSP
jgi:hypothetical protein